MERLDGGSAVPAHLRGGIVALGNFDGFHKGHQAVVGRAVDRARIENRPALVATFDPHPMRYFRPDSPWFRLTTLEQRERLILAAGVDAVLVFQFDAEFAAVTAPDFVTEWLVRRMGVAGVVTGDDFTFGKARGGDVDLLRMLGKGHRLSVDTVAPVMEGDRAVSSTWIREALHAGDCETATHLLTRPHTIEGVVEHGDGRGHALGFPTANIVLGNFLRPRYGVYAVRGRLDPGSGSGAGTGRVLDGVANLGIRPMFDPPKELLEPHFLDFDGDLYGQRIEVELVSFLRDEFVFDDIEALKAQIARDAEQAQGEIGEMKIRTTALVLVAGACLTLTLLNASWIAPKPAGELAVIAHRGIVQPEDPAPDGCPARHVRMLSHGYIENTLLSMRGAVAYGARGFALDVQTSADGHAMIFRDPTLECRTNGSGRVSERPLAYLKGLDVGYGYTSDGGQSFRLRGRGAGAMPTAAEAIRAFPRLILIFKLEEPAAADAIVAAFREAGTAIGERHGFAGTPEAMARLRTLTQAGWVLDPAASEACLSDYRRTGWTGLAPDTCRSATLNLPRDGGWTLWGWPYRFLDRMAGAGARTIVTRDPVGEALAGLDEPEQLGEVPHDYRGMLLIEDMFGTGQALER